MFSMEANNISKAFPPIKMKDILSFLTKYGPMGPEERIKSTVRDILEILEEEDTSEQITADASVIQGIFPDIPPVQIFSKLSLLGNEFNRIRIVIKDIVADDERKIFNRDIEYTTVPILPQHKVNNKRKSDINKSRKKIKVKHEPEDLSSPDEEVVNVENNGGGDFSNVFKTENVGAQIETEGPSIKQMNNLIDIVNQLEDFLKPKTLPSPTSDMPLLTPITVPDIKPSTSSNITIDMSRFCLNNQEGNRYHSDDIKYVALPQNRSRNNIKSSSSSSKSDIIEFKNIKREYDITINNIDASIDRDLIIPLKKANIETIVSRMKLENYPDSIKEEKTASQNMENFNVVQEPTTSLGRKDKLNYTNTLSTVKKEPIEIQCKVNPSCIIRTNSNEFEVIDSDSDPDDGIDLNLLYRIMEIFPEADPQFLRDLCRDRKFSAAEIDSLINIIFSMPHYPKRSLCEEVDEAVDPDVQIDILKQVLPDADPTYLMNRLQSISTQDELKIFLSQALEKRNYPTYKDYLRNQKLSAQVKDYTTEFSIEKFVDLIPDPEAYFNSSERKFVTTDRKNSSTYYHMLNFLKNIYTQISVVYLKGVFDKTMNIMQACKDLDKSKSGLLRTRRKASYSLEGITDIPLLQVFAYIQHKNEILMYIESKKIKEKQEREDMKRAGLMRTCGCCYDDEVIPSDIVNCPNGCIFCKFCLEKSVEILFSEGKLEFPCLANCGTKFSIQVLQIALKPKLFSKMAQKQQLEEVKAAGIEDLESCPFCDFATIPPTNEKIFKCLNPDCMKESCRNCQETSHIPLRCDEVEKDSDVEKRTYVENKMTEALIRKCFKCGMKFIKADGCNKMTCSCGATMCYVCNKPVTDYKHFNGQGGDRHDLCPLYSDTNVLHKEAVLRSAATAKAEVGNNLKVDPTLNVQEYYDGVISKAPKAPPGIFHR